ncbi:hypothetical protein GCM10027570_12740 [Streptomonospora sediminis]
MSAGAGLAAVGTVAGAVAGAGAAAAEELEDRYPPGSGNPGEPTQTITISPIVLSTPGRTVPLEVRVTVPVTKHKVPVILLSHGHGETNFLNSFLGYAPLVDYYSAHGFAVIQPTHLDATMLGLRDADDPDAPMYARARAEDMSHIIDQLDTIESAVPQLRTRLDRNNIAVVGHSLGGHTAGLLLGMRFADPSRGGRTVSLIDRRVKTGVLMAAPGRGGDALNEGVVEQYPATADPDFSTMNAPALIVAGERDASARFTHMGPRWRMDSYYLSPGPKTLLTMLDAEHMLGGVGGYDSALTTDENPERVAAVGRLSAAYLRTAFDAQDPAWQEAQDALTTGADALGRVESK